MDQGLERSIEQLGVLPKTLATLVNAIGRIDTPAYIYHAGIPNVADQTRSASYSFLLIEDLRRRLDEFTRMPEIDFMQLNSIPGLLLDAQGRPLNIEAVIPEHPNFAKDVLAMKQQHLRQSQQIYKKLQTKVASLYKNNKTRRM